MAEPITTNEKLTTVKQLVNTAEQVAENFATKKQHESLKKTVEGISISGGAGEMNVIDSITVNGQSVEVKEKTAEITIEIPESIDDLNDSERISTLESQMSQKADSSTLEGYVQSEGLKDAVEEQGFKTEDDLKETFVENSTLAETVSSAGFAKTEAVAETYATKNELNAYTNTETLQQNYLQKDGLEAALGESSTVSEINTSLDSKLETVTVNGQQATKTNPIITLTMAEIDALQEYKKFTEIQAWVNNQIAATKHASYQIVEQLPNSSDAQENVMYLLKKEGKAGYDIYILEGAEDDPQLKWVDDTSADLEGYAKSSAVTEEILQKLSGYTPTAELESKISEYGFAKLSEIAEQYLKTTDLDTKIEGLNKYAKKTELETTKTETISAINTKYNYDEVARKTLSQENFTTELKTKLEGIRENATKVEVGEEKNGTITVNGEQKTVYELPSDVVHRNEIATDTEVEELIKEIFGDLDDDDTSSTNTSPTEPNSTIASDKEVQAAISDVFSGK